MESKNLTVTIPRGSGKRLTTILAAIQKAKEGYSVVIYKPIKKQTDDVIIGRKLDVLDEFIRKEYKK